MTTMGKLLALFIALMTITAIGIGWQTYKTAQEGLIEATKSKLQAIRVTKKQQIEHHFNELRNQCLTFSESTMIIDAMKAFKQGFTAVPKELNVTQGQLDTQTEFLKNFYQEEFLKKLNAFIETPRRFIDYAPTSPNGILLQNLYIAKNPNPFGSKSNLDAAQDSTSYTKTHAYYHPIIREFMKRFGYADISLVDHETGDIVYLYSKEIDFANNLTHNLLKESNFARLYEKLLTVSTKNTALITDFASYDPSFAAPAGFIGAPIFEGNKKIGFIIIQFSLDALNDIMTNNAHWQEIGLGKTGENLLVGRDRFMRSSSRFFLENPIGYQQELEKLKTSPKVIDKIRAYNTTVLQQQLTLPIVQEIFKGKSGVLLDRDYRNKQVIGSYEPINFQELEWGIVTKIDRSEVALPLEKLLTNLPIISLLLIALSTLLMSLGLRSLLSPIDRIARYCSHIANGWKSNTLQALLLPLETSDDMAYLATQINKLVYTHEKEIDQIAQKKMEITKELNTLQGYLNNFLQEASNSLDAPSEFVAKNERLGFAALYNVREMLTYIREHYKHIAEYAKDMQEIINEQQQQIVALDKLLYQHKSAFMSASSSSDQAYVFGERLGEMQALLRRLENNAQEQKLFGKKVQRLIRDVTEFEATQNKLVQDLGLDPEPHALIDRVKDYIKMLKNNIEEKEQLSKNYKNVIEQIKEKLAFFNFN